MRYLLSKCLAYLRAQGVSGLLRKVVRYVQLQVATLGAVPVLRRRARAVASISDAFDFAQSFSFYGVEISALQRREEIEALLEVVEEIRPRVLVEIGTALGGTLFMFSRVAADDALLVSIDLRGGEFGGGYPLARVPLYRAFARARQSVRLIRADSHSESTVARARRLLGGRPVDVLFIDGDHTYDGVRRDFELYLPLVRPGGLVAFHDITRAGNARVGSPLFWDELEEQHPERTRRLLKAPDQRGMGIGLLHVPES